VNGLLYVGLGLLIAASALIAPALLRLYSGTSRLLRWTAALALTGSAALLGSALTSTGASAEQRWATGLVGVLCGAVLAATVALLTRD